jgi:hypothetical protein
MDYSTDPDTCRGRGWDGASYWQTATSDQTRCATRSSPPDRHDRTRSCAFHRDREVEAPLTGGGDARVVFASTLVGASSLIWAGATTSR